jgi:hypothetical protein
MKEKQAEEWTKEYQMLAVKKRSDKEEKRLAELPCKLSDYRLSDPLKFDKKFQSIIRKILGHNASLVARILI